MRIETQMDTATTPAVRRRPGGPLPRAIPRTWLETPEDASVEALELSPWAHRALRHSGIATAGELAAWSARQLAVLPGVGPKTYRELERLLSVLHQRFGAVGPGLASAVDEIVAAVLDAADVEILEGEGPASGKRLRALMFDMLERYQERRRRELYWLRHRRILPERREACAI